MQKKMNEAVTLLVFDNFTILFPFQKGKLHSIPLEVKYLWKDLKTGNNLDIKQLLKNLAPMFESSHNADKYRSLVIFTHFSKVTSHFFGVPFLLTKSYLVEGTEFDFFESLCLCFRDF